MCEALSQSLCTIKKNERHDGRRRTGRWKVGGREGGWEGSNLFKSLSFLTVLLHDGSRRIGLITDEHERVIEQENNHNHTNIII